ncbi:hypothetical protein P4647_25530 [Peribacillus frigoritolerans]|uniref:hypothetical protein n=1 Tax=Peribacillus frigoritolerans TaxID=450367 RepID=UPI002E1EE502|nr:hypothetical protein [Peribacillus frigoritolerans]
MLDAIPKAAWFNCLEVEQIEKETTTGKLKGVRRAPRFSNVNYKRFKGTQPILVGCLFYAYNFFLTTNDNSK